MARPLATGRDRRGNTLYLRTPEGEIVERVEPRTVFRSTPSGDTVVETINRRTMVEHDELPNVVRRFQEWVLLLNVCGG